MVALVEWSICVPGSSGAHGVEWYGARFDGMK